MQYRRFGRTELSMPVFSTGGMRYQDGWKDKPLNELSDESQRNMEAIIARSLELGVNHIETARGYGPSERQLGQILPGYPREDLIVQTKIGPNDDAKQFVADFEDSLSRLNLDYVDLLAIHGINAEQPLRQSLGAGRCFEMCQKLREQGKCRFVGFSTHGSVAAITEAIEYGQAVTGQGFDYVNLHWYYIMQRNWPCIEAARQRDMGVFLISPTDKGGHLHTPTEKLKQLCHPLHPIVFNDLFCLDHPEVHTLSLGAARPSDYDLHMQALELYDQRHELLPPIIERLEQAMAEATGHTSPEAYENEMPEPENTPGGLNLKVILWLRLLAMGWDMTPYGKARFNLMGNAGHWFPGAKVTESFEQIDENDLVSACRPSPYAEQVPGMVQDAIDRLGGEEVKRQSQS